MPVVILDSTVLVSAGQFTGTSVALLRKLLGRSDFSLKIPWVVREELINKYREQLSEKVNKVETAIKNLNKILPLTNDAVPSNKLNIVEIVHQYTNRLDNFLSSVNAEVIEPDQISHRKLVIKDLARQNHFPPKGEVIEML